jgi:hypothetical protein
MTQAQQQFTSSGQIHPHGSGQAPAELTGGGWITFAAVMMVLAGAANLLWAIAAFANDDYFRAGELLFGDLSAWGAAFLAIGVTQLLTALLLFNRHELGAMLGIVLATGSAFAQLMGIGAYPIWSVIVLVIDGLVIYGLCVYGFAQR